MLDLRASNTSHGQEQGQAFPVLLAKYDPYNSLPIRPTAKTNVFCVLENEVFIRREEKVSRCVQRMLGDTRQLPITSSLPLSAPPSFDCVDSIPTSWTTVQVLEPSCKCASNKIPSLSN